MAHTRDLNSQKVVEAFDLGESPGQLISDGATGGTGRCLSQSPGTRGAVNGAASLTWRGVVTLPTSTIGNYTIATIGFVGTNPGGPQTDNQMLFIGVGPNGNRFRINQLGTGGNYINNREFNSSSAFFLAYRGQTGILEVAFTAGTANPVVRWNDVDVSNLFVTVTTGPTVPDWLDNSFGTTTYGTGQNWPAGPVPVGCWILGTLTDADRTFWRTTGRPPWWVARGGFAVPMINTFVAPGTPYSTFTGATASGFSAAEVTAAGGARSARAQLTTLRTELGRIITVRFTVTLNSGVLPAVSITNASGSGVASGQSTTAGANERTFIVNSNADNSINSYVNFNTAAETDYVISNLSVSYPGALSLLGVQIGNAVTDCTVIGTNPAALIGLTPTPQQSNTGQISAVVSWTGTHENKNIGSTISLPSNAVITGITTLATSASSGSGLTIGSPNTPARYVALNTYSANIMKSHTLANAIPVGTAANDLALTIDPDTANYTGSITVTIFYTLSNSL